VTGGYTYQDFRPKNKSNYNFENNNTTVESFIPTRYNLQSFFARTNLTIADKYIVTASLDGWYRDLQDYRWSNFPAVAVAWKLNEESF
jgi:iron complex outermembrane receptor protein